MILARREFLKLLGVAAGTAGLGGCERLWSVPDELVAAALRGPGIETFAQTICGLCEGGCGLTVRLVDGLPVGLKGNPRHPLNRGGLCPVGHAGLEVLYAPERLQTPLRRGPDGRYAAIDWDAALGEIIDRLTAMRSAAGAHRLAILSGEPGELFHDLVARFAQAFGTPNLARPSDAAVLAYRLTQGIDRVPGFDLARADLVFSFGLDLFEDGPSPLHAIAALIGSRPTPSRGALLHVGTRLSPTAAKAEEHVAVRPGTHGALALGIAHVLVREGLYDQAFVADHTFGFEDWVDEAGHRRLGFRRLLLEQYYPDRAAQLSGCDPAQIVRLARRLAASSAPVAVAGGEATQGENGTWTAMAVHSLNALLGAFDRPGGVVLPPPIPLTPLAPLPAPAAAVDSLFAADRGSGAFGSDPVAALAQRLGDGSYPLEVLFVVGADPVFSSPVGERLRRVLAQVPLVVAFASFLDETAAAADLILPMPSFLETWQESTTPPTVPCSVLGLAHPVVPARFETHGAGDVLLELARRLGEPVAAALPWPSYEAYLKHRLEGLLASGQGTVISGSFAESWVHFLEERGWRFLETNDLEGFWEDLAREAGWWNPAYATGAETPRFPTPSGRFEFFSRALERRRRELGVAVAEDAAVLPHHEPVVAAGEGLALIPFRPLTGRGRLGVTSPMVLEMFGYPVLSGWETWAELAPETAHELDLEDGDRVALESAGASIEVVVRVQPGATPGTVHVPLGLGRSPGHGAGGGIGANPLRLMAEVHDPLSGALSLTSARVRARLVERRRHGGPPPAEGHA
jgi:anaerobic selenocysteine-containing dehydrogenase